MKLPARAKSLYDGLKTLAWPVETDLVNAIAPFYRRAEYEGRTLIAAALRVRGAAMLAQGRADDALVALEAAVAGKKVPADAWWYLADALHALGRDH